MRGLVRRPSPSMVVACVALLVALGGTSVAAVSVALPRNSVGTPQLKNNAVTSSKIATGAVASADVKDHSLLRADFSPGQIPAGPSDAYVRFLTGPIAVPLRSETTLASLSIPQAGNYLLIAKAGVSGHGTVTCRLEAGSDFDLSQATPAASANQTITNVVAHTFTVAGSADFKCAGDGDAGASFIRVAAIKVGNLARPSG